MESLPHLEVGQGGGVPVLPPVVHVQPVPFEDDQAWGGRGAEGDGRGGWGFFGMERMEEEEEEGGGGEFLPHSTTTTDTDTQTALPVARKCSPPISTLTVVRCPRASSEQQARKCRTTSS